MPSVAVRGLEQQDISGGNGLRVPQHRSIVPAEVASKDDPLAALQHHRHCGCTKEVTHG
jgi:hypothetical protein